MQILIVENQHDVLECLEQYFTHQGHEVVTATTVKQATECLDHFHPKFAVVDLLLPGGNGRSVIREIIRRKLGTQIVVITGCDDPGLRLELLQLGVRDFLFKPVTLRDIEVFLEAIPASVPHPPQP